MNFIFLIIGIITLFFIVLLLTPFVIELDTRTPHANIRWGYLGKARVWHTDEWWFSIRFLFFHKTMPITNMKVNSSRQKYASEKQKLNKKMSLEILLNKIFQTIKTFQVIQWTLYIDTGDNVYNAQLYPLNFYSKTYNHLFINFRNETFLLLKIRNYPWKIVYTYLK